MFGGKKFLGTNFTYKRKTKSIGEVERYKVRLVVLGSQKLTDIRQGVGGLMLATAMARTEIASTVGIVANFLNNPGQEHWKAVQKILQYLLRTKDLGLIYGGGGADSLVLSAMADSDHGTCIDSRRSVSGGAVFLGGAAIL